VTVVGFDFGTTNSLVSVVAGDRVIDVLDGDGGLPFPSVVRFEGSRVVVGREAKEQLGDVGMGVHGNTVTSPKTFLGRSSIVVGGLERRPIDVVAEVIKHVKERSLRGDWQKNLGDLSQAVVTIPINMSGARRSELREAFRMAGIGVAQFVHEPFAALYGHLRGSESARSNLRRFDRRNVLVVDWGGGTLDVTLCRIEDGRVSQIRNSGTEDVGGDAFDDAIRNGVVRSFLEATSQVEAPEIDDDAWVSLLHGVERAKIDLSSRDSVMVYERDLFRGQSSFLKYELGVDEMQEMTNGLLRAGVQRVRDVVDAAGLSPSQVSLCLLTGGMASMPAVRMRLTEVFGPQAVVLPDNSSTLISQGAAWIAHDRSRLVLAKGVDLRLARGSMLRLLDAGLKMPGEREVESREFSLYCVDPTDGHAKFEVCTPIDVGVTAADPATRSTLGVLAVQVDSKADPFFERLPMRVSIDEDLILHVAVESTNFGDFASEEVHELEFGVEIPMPGVDGPGGAIAGLPAVGGEEADAHEDGIPLATSAAAIDRNEIQIRSNVSDRKDPSLVPGEVLYRSNPGYFDRRRRPPRLQVEERGYYSDCAICGRKANDPGCTCISGPAGSR
jgi:actin-like ATPase involved in cell morphogenesis